MNEIILQNKEGQILASSLEIAERFEKEHSKVKRSIKSLEKDVANFGEMFKISYYKDAYERKQEEYLMNRDGFSLIVMGFTGKKALEWKLKYIEAFNIMEEKLKSGNYLSEEEKLKLQLFSKDPVEVAYAHNRLVELATAPLIAENKRMKPKEEFHDAVSIAENCINFGEFAAVFQNNRNISFGRNKIIDWCRKQDYLCSSYNLKNKPSQQMIDKGYMKYKESVNEYNGKHFITYTPLLTGKGQIWLTEKLSKYFKEIA